MLIHLKQEVVYSLYQTRQNGFFNLGIATGLGDEKLQLNAV